MTLSDFVSTYNGKSVDVDGSYGYQCWDLAAEYSRSVVGVPPHDFFPFGLPTGDGCAAGVFANFQAPLPRYYDRIDNVPNDPTVTPQAGDLVVWNYTSPGSGGSGHIGVCLSANASSFISFDQNWNGPYAAKIAHNYNYVLGWLRPKAVNQGDNMIQDTDLEYARWKKLAQQIRGEQHNFTRDEFRTNAVGRTWLNAIEILSDDPEADRAQRWMEVGRTAVTDDWEQQIHSLQDQLNAVKQQVDELKKALAIKDSTITDLESKLATSGADTSNLNALGVALRWLIGRLGLK
jgi:hypothetical protein